MYKRIPLVALLLALAFAPAMTPAAVAQAPAEPQEYAAGHIQGAVNIPIRTLGQNLGKLPAAKDTEIVVMCVSGLRAAYVTMTLTLMGYTNVKDMALGMREWTAQNFPVVK